MAGWGSGVLFDKVPSIRLLPKRHCREMIHKMYIGIFNSPETRAADDTNQSSRYEKISNFYSIQIEALLVKVFFFQRTFFCRPYFNPNQFRPRLLICTRAVVFVFRLARFAVNRL